MTTRSALIGGCAVVVLVVGWLAATLPRATTAHGGEDDVGHAVLTVMQDRRVASVEILLSQVDACDRFAPRRLVGQRAERTVTGSLAHVAACRFSGTISLPGPGRWLVTVQLTYDDRLAEVAIPIGVTHSRGRFERADAAHAAPPQAGFWETRRTLVIGAAGLLLGTVPEVARRRWARPVRRSTSLPTSGG